MAVSLKHKFVSAKSDGGDTSLVRPSNWNDEHDLVLATNKLLGRATAGTGAVEEIDCTAFARSILDDADEATFKATVNLEIGVDVQAYDADTMKADTADVLTAGFAATAYDAGTKSSGTYTPDEANGNFQYATNGGAHTLAPPSNVCTVIILYANNASAGTITTSGFTMVTGDDLTTTDGHEFLLYVTKHNNGTAFSHLHVTALQ